MNNDFKNLDEIINAAQRTPFAAMFNPCLFFAGMRFIVREELEKLEAAAEKSKKLPPHMTKKQVAEYLSCSTRSVDSRIEEGLLTIERVGRRVYFDRKEVEKLFQKK